MVPYQLPLYVFPLVVGKIISLEKLPLAKTSWIGARAVAVHKLTCDLWSKISCEFLVCNPGRLTAETWNITQLKIWKSSESWTKPSIFGFQIVNFAGCISNSASVAKQQKR